MLLLPEPQEKAEGEDIPDKENHINGREQPGLPRAAWTAQEHHHSGHTSQSWQDWGQTHWLVDGPKQVYSKEAPL